MTVEVDTAAPIAATAVWGDRSQQQKLWSRVINFRLLGYGVAALFAALAVYPVGRVLFSLIHSGGRFTTRPLHEAFDVPGLGTIVWQTGVLVLASTTVALAVGSGLAWLNERTDARIGWFSDSIPMMPFLLPPIAGAVGWVLLASPSAGLLNFWIRSALGWFGLHPTQGPVNIYSWYGLIFVYTLYQVPYAFMLVSAGLRNLDSSLEEASRVARSGSLRTLVKVTLPALRPSIASAALLMFWQGFSLYSVPVIIGTQAKIQTLSVEIVKLLTFTYPPKTAQAIGLSIIVLAFVSTAWYAQTRVLRSQRNATVGSRGQRHTRVSLGAWRPVCRAVILLYGVLAVILPIVALLLVTLNNFWTPHIHWSHLNLRSVKYAFVQDTATVTSIKNSLVIGVIGATIGMTVAAIIALHSARARGRSARLFGSLIKMPSIVSHLVIAVGMIFAFAGPPFRLAGTTTILLMAYLVVYLPQGLVSAEAAASQVDGSLAEASAVSGAGFGRTVLKIYRPLMMPGLVAGWSFLFACMIGDLTATAILSGSTNTVVGFRLLEIFDNGTYAELAAVALALTLAAMLVVGMSVAFVRRRAKWEAGTGR